MICMTKSKMEINKQKQKGSLGKVSIGVGLIL